MLEEMEWPTHKEWAVICGASLLVMAIGGLLAVVGFITVIQWLVR